MIEEAVEMDSKPEKNVAEILASRAAVELLRVISERPHLARRCEKAAEILADHARHRGARIIRAQVRGGKLVGYLVSGSRRQVYRIEASGKWRCSCPDYHRRDAVCKHGLAAWALHRAASRVEYPKESRTEEPCLAST